jgi:PhzF family phenazine biosynthesis protein
MEIPIYQVDAFTSTLFRGNPAAVCPLSSWLPDSLLLAIAAENNLAETAFYVPEGDLYRLRWFTPTVEVQLCGHATVATATVMMAVRGEISGPWVRFLTLSGEIGVERDGDLYRLDFPVRPPQPKPASAALIAAIGTAPVESYVSATGYNMLVYETEAQVRALQPDMAKLALQDPTIVTAPGGEAVTAPGETVDFVSRMFGPSHGIPEDPVTGSSHTVLTPYWSARLGKKSLRARQVSARGGELWCEDRGERIAIAGKSVLYLQGTIQVDASA